jgi:predicted alpha/beta-hydrolase family hydrolase
VTHTTPSASPSVEWRVEVGGDVTKAVFEPAATRQTAVFICAHGAGGHMSDRGMLRVTETLRSVGLGVVRFNFLYRKRGSGRPDAMPRLKECVAAVVEHARATIQPKALLIGGRSMGGRAASMLAADGFASDGLLLLAYPLHPAGLPHQLRDAHLPAIKVPVLCFNGTRDALCRRDLMESALAKVQTSWTMHWLEGADHSFHVLKSSGRTDADVLDEIAGATKQWLPAVAP